MLDLSSLSAKDIDNLSKQSNQIFEQREKELKKLIEEIKAYNEKHVA